MIESESRLLIGAADVKVLDVGVGGDGGDVEQIVRENRPDDIESVKDLASAR